MAAVARGVACIAIRLYVYTPVDAVWEHHSITYEGGSPRSACSPSACPRCDGSVSVPITTITSADEGA